MIIIKIILMLADTCVDTFEHQQNMTISAQQSQENKLIVGKVENFISYEQLCSRVKHQFQINKQHPNREPIASFMRSKKYSDKNTRTPQALYSCLKFILEQYMPFLFENFADQKIRGKIIQFIYVRIMAIRCQYYVQEVFNPEASLIIIKTMILLQSLIEKPLRIVGLDNFLHLKQQRMLTQSDENLKIYIQSIRIAIFWSNKQQFLEILDSHYDKIEQLPQLIEAVNIKKKILNNNYHAYFRSLASENTDIYCRLILWSQIKKIRQLYTSRMIAANMNEKLPFVCKVLGHKKKDGWVNLREQQKKNYPIFEGLTGQFDLVMKPWIPVKSLLKAIQNLSGKQQQSK